MLGEKNQKMRYFNNLMLLDAFSCCLYLNPLKIVLFTQRQIRAAERRKKAAARRHAMMERRGVNKGRDPTLKY
jgi:hypothetical protein